MSTVEMRKKIIQRIKAMDDEQLIEFYTLSPYFNEKIDGFETNDSEITEKLKKTLANLNLAKTKPHDQFMKEMKTWIIR